MIRKHQIKVFFAHYDVTEEIEYDPMIFPYATKDQTDKYLELINQNNLKDLEKELKKDWNVKKDPNNKEEITPYKRLMINVRKKLLKEYKNIMI